MCDNDSYDSDGEPLWTRAIDTEEGREGIADLAITPDGDVLALGHTNDSADCGLGPMEPNGSFDSWICVLSGETGEPLWGRQVGGIGSDGGNNPSMAARPDGGVLVATAFGETGLFGGEPLRAEATEDGAVVAYDSEGEVVWQDAFGGMNYNYAEGVAAAGDEVVVLGTIEGTVELGGAEIISPSPFGGFVARLDAQGQHLWSLTVHVIKFCGVDTDEAGNSYLAAPFSGVATVVGPGGTGQSFTSAGDTDVFVLAISPEGELLWSATLGGAGSDTCFDMDYGDGEVAVTGWYESALTLPDGSVFEPRGAAYDGWMLTLDAATGAQVDALSFGGEGHFDVGRAVGLDQGGQWLGGSYDEGEGELDGLSLRSDTEAGFLLRRLDLR